MKKVFIEEKQKVSIVKKERVSISCIFIEGEKVLIAKRKNEGQMANRWEFPGGKVEEGESDSKAIEREMKEEFEVEVRVGEKLCETSFIHNGEERSLHAYICFLSYGVTIEDLKLTEHVNCKWARIEEIDLGDFVPSDAKTIPYIEKYIG